MSKKLPPTEIETFTIGPTCCGHFNAGRDLCNYCIANGMYSHALCFVRPSISQGTKYDEQNLQAVADIVSGGKTNPRP